MNKNKQKNQLKMQRAARTRAKVKAVSDGLRLSIFRSAKHISAQVIDDKKGITLVSANDFEIKKGDKKAKALQVGELIGSKCKEKKVEKVAFDKGSYKYHGRVKELAEGARKAGLKF